MLKRIFDIIMSFFGLLFCTPFFFLIALAIKITSDGGVFFKQQRIGFDGKIFVLVKFRTMSIMQDSSSSVSVKGDCRITRVGVFLRKYKLDELPELWNVLIGEMSFVGPRPDVPGYADMLKGEGRKILELKPGITGAASLKYANEEEILALQENPEQYNMEVIFPDKVRINLDYYYNNNLWIDIKIIFATIFRTTY